MRHAIPLMSRRFAAASLLLCVATAVAGCTAGSEPEAVPPLSDVAPTQQPPGQAAPLDPELLGGSEEDPLEGSISQRLALAPGVNAEFTAGTWESGPAEWLEVTSRCQDLLLFVGRNTSVADDREARFWVYWRSDDALPWDQVTIADSFGEFGWGTPSDAALVPPERISARTEWIEIVRYERWPAPGPSTDPEEPSMDPADGFAVIARTVAPAGYVGVGSVIIGDRSASDHDPRHVLETLELDLQAVIDSCA
jgi:hypothetical protein